MRIVFHGENAGSFSEGFAEKLGTADEIVLLPDPLSTDAERAAYAGADVIIGVRFNANLPRPTGLKLFHVPGAGYDGIDFTALPSGAVVCNCFGHEQAIAEYVMAALLLRHVPLPDADARLRKGDWAYWAGSRTRVHDEIAGKTIGLLGFGHIGKAIAKRARAFEMRVHVANRSTIDVSDCVDEYFSFAELDSFWRSADAFVVSLPLTEDTRGLVGAASFNAMSSHAVIVNVGRGPVVDEQALYDALYAKRIGGAIIDTWYRYPSPGTPNTQPATLPFHELPNVLMTPHMSGWTNGTVGRRQDVIADNIRRCGRSELCVNMVTAS